MNYGLAEIGNIATKASSNAIRKLKSILDRHGIYHIVDGITFFHPHPNAARLKENHQGRVGEVDKTKDPIRKRKIHHSDCSQYRELIVLDLYELNYMSLIFFDSDEADFLATLVYEGDRKGHHISKKSK